MSWIKMLDLDNRIKELEDTRPFLAKQEIELLGLYRDKTQHQKKLGVGLTRESILEELNEIEIEVTEITDDNDDRLLVLELRREYLEQLFSGIYDEQVVCPYCSSAYPTHNPCGQTYPCNCPSEDEDFYCNACHAS